MVDGEKVPKRVKVLCRGECFGSLSFFTGFGRSINARSIEFTTLSVLKRADFIDILLSF